MLNLFALFLSGILHISGDVLTRKAVNGSWLFLVAGSLCFAALAPIWVYLYRTQAMPVVACTYVPVMAVVLAFAGVVIFGDTMSPRLWVAAAFAMAAILIVAWPTSS